MLFRAEVRALRFQPGASAYGQARGPWGAISAVHCVVPVGKAGHLREADFGKRVEMRRPQCAALIVPYRLPKIVMDRRCIGAARLALLDDELLQVRGPMARCGLRSFPLLHKEILPLR